MAPPAAGRAVLQVEAGEVEAGVGERVGAEVRGLLVPVHDVLVDEDRLILRRREAVRQQGGGRRGVLRHPAEVEHPGIDDQLRCER